MKRIAIVAIGSWGDVGPLITLGAGLAGAGYEVVLVTHAAYAGDAGRAGLDFAPLSGDPVAIPEDERGRQWLESGGNGLRFALDLVRIARPLQRTVLDEAYAACRSCTAVLHTPFASFATHVAERLALPSIVVGQQPVTRTGAWRAFLVPDGLPLGRLGNRLSYRLMEQAVWQPYRAGFQRWRREVGMPDAGPFGPAGRLYTGRVPVVYGFSSLVVPPPADWPAWHHAAGYWMAPARGSWDREDARVAAFLDDGPPPVFVGFGSMTARKPERVLARVVEALRVVGQRGLLTGAAGTVRAAGALPPRLDAPDMLVAEGFSHARALPGVAAAVHHGGAGTVATSLAAGVPTVVVPFFADQFFWGRRVAALGAGPDPLPMARLDAAGLAGRLRAVLASPPMRERAADLGARLRAEDGVAAAVEVIDRHLAGAPGPRPETADG